MSPAGSLVDSHGRTLRDLRVSLTDRCNFRCLYCLPETEAAQNFYRGHWARCPTPNPSCRNGCRKPTFPSRKLSAPSASPSVWASPRSGSPAANRCSGRNSEKLVARIATIPGIEDLAMTTNGFLFAEKAHALRAAGLRRVSFSMDSLDRDNFKKMTGRDGLDSVKKGIRLAEGTRLHAGKGQRRRHPRDQRSRARIPRRLRARQAVSLRFIEFMPLDSARAWQREMVVPGAEILRRLQARFDLRLVANDNPSSTSKRWAHADGRGEIGIIAPVSEPFCGHCNRIRLTADGKVRACLFSVTEHDLRSPPPQWCERCGFGSLAARRRLAKEARHHIGEPEFVAPPRSMSCIGG